MPELPEVETTLRGIRPALLNRRIADITVRNPALRIPVGDRIKVARGRVINGLRRRAKYLLIDTPAPAGAKSGAEGGLMIHLGMSGSLRICAANAPTRKHDHVDLVLEGGTVLRFNDPRRFGIFTWWDAPAESHPLIRDLGPEPLGEAFTGTYLYRRSRGLRVSVKNFLMNARVVVGVGNIYASEALHLAGIHPVRAAGRIAEPRYVALAEATRSVLENAIRQGGTTLRDFTAPDSQPGYFAQELQVYDRAGAPCYRCGAPIRKRVIGQRSSYYCLGCQT
ncbi:MAG: bifunctional DNA-formamidopyrimidine glycosylase/DNA-(apurinic or apyrimidinic site) lyase [Xanthomonadales bacterium]|nr:bifunctional DNA-formamidopyrimidine glycosylase/DNA-(apurinic or apyrimidinic site) lyase [Xanthomonadales bacterium]